MRHHAKPAGAKPGPSQHLPQGLRREVREMTRQIEAVPGRAKRAKRQAVDVRHGDVEPSAGSKQIMRLSQGSQRIVHVLQRLAHGDQVEAGGTKAREGEIPRQGRQPQLLTDPQDDRSRGVHPQDLPSPGVHLLQKSSAPTAEIEQTVPPFAR